MSDLMHYTVHRQPGARGGTQVAKWIFENIINILPRPWFR